jgi:hypothetical protein
MGKKNKPKYPPSSSNLRAVDTVAQKNNSQQSNPTPPIESADPHSTLTAMVQPEQMSLNAHQHIQCYLQNRHQQLLDKNDLNAVLRLSQHLRVFGLLSAAGYVNQSNDQGGEVRERTVPVWESLLGQLIDENNPPRKQNLMEKVTQMARNEPNTYMMTWRKALTLSKYWNFWARAYSGDD